MQYLSQGCVGYEMLDSRVFQYENGSWFRYFMIAIDFYYFTLYTFKIIEL